MKTPDYVLSQNHSVMADIWNETILEAGTFVKPISEQYVPQHVKDKTINVWFDAEEFTYAYTPIGIVMIPIKIIRRIG